MTSAEPPDTTLFELTVEGSLGPVLRCALGTGTVDRPRTCTTIQVAVGTDLTGLVELLHSKGLQIEAISLVAGRAGKSAPSPGVDPRSPAWWPQTR